MQLRYIIIIIIFNFLLLHRNFCILHRLFIDLCLRFVILCIIGAKVLGVILNASVELDMERLFVLFERKYFSER